MNRWEIFGAIVFGAVFAAFAFWRVDVVDSNTVRAIVAVFLFGFYCAIVAFGSSGKKRTLSLPGQTLLGIVFACAMAALFAAPPLGYLVAVLLGLVLGFTADKWVEFVQFP